MNSRDEDIAIRVATPDDAAALLAIYAPYVADTAVTFEYEVPSLDEFRSRIEQTLKRYPYIVAEIDGEIVGYAYLSAFHPRIAYQWAAETSIYLKKDYHTKGIGRLLYQELERIANAQHLVSLRACISYSEVEDEHLTQDSVRFHEHMGYKLNGVFNKCGYKFGRWYDVVWMEKFLIDPPQQPEDVIPFSDKVFR